MELSPLKRNMVLQEPVPVVCLVVEGYVFLRGALGGGCFFFSEAHEKGLSTLRGEPSLFCLPDLEGQVLSK